MAPQFSRRTVLGFLPAMPYLLTSAQPGHRHAELEAACDRLLHQFRVPGCVVSCLEQRTGGWTVARGLADTERTRPMIALVVLTNGARGQQVSKQITRLLIEEDLDCFRWLRVA
jgi:hypothetical protein